MTRERLGEAFRRGALGARLVPCPSLSELDVTHPTKWDQSQANVLSQHLRVTYTIQCIRNDEKRSLLSMGITASIYIVYKDSMSLRLYTRYALPPTTLTCTASVNWGWRR
jgi:hypothetical protein